MYDRHAKVAEEWFPHDYIPYRLGRDFDKEPWTPEQPRLTGIAQTAFEVNLLTEDNLPSYHRLIHGMFGTGDGAWINWIGRWTAEEGRHAIVLRDYLTVTRNLDPIALERGRTLRNVRSQRNNRGRETSLSRPVPCCRPRLETRHHALGILRDHQPRRPLGVRRRNRTAVGRDHGAFSLERGTDRRPVGERGTDVVVWRRRDARVDRSDGDSDADRTDRQRRRLATGGASGDDDHG